MKSEQYYVYADVYGSDGNNMSFSVDSACNVTITFNEATKHSSVSGANISNVDCETKIIPFDGYSVIFSSDIFNGYHWLPTGSELEAAKAGKMTLNEETGLYERIVTLTNSSSVTEKNYAYKVIKNAVDSGENKYFYLKDSSEDSISISPTDDDNSLEYNVTYRNDTSYEKLSFAVLDVLPFNGSKRNYKNGTVGKATTYANNNWKLKSIKVTYSNETTKVKG